MTVIPIYPAGVDLLWLARDKRNRLAAFITAGVGQVPVDILGNDPEKEDVESLILDFPKVCDAVLHVAVPRPDDFVAYAERGLFVFDWRDLHRSSSEESGCYELVASPSRIKPIADTMDQSFVRSILLPELDLSESKRVCLRDVNGFIGPTMEKQGSEYIFKK